MNNLKIYFIACGLTKSLPCNGFKAYRKKINLMLKRNEETP